MSLRALLAVGAVAVTAAGGYFAYSSSQNGQEVALKEFESVSFISSAQAANFKAKEVDTTDYGDDARIFGDPNAPVTVLEFASMTCGHCGAFHNEKWPELKKKYVDTGMVKFVFKDFPFDQRAAGASMMARCVADDKYFAAVGALFKTQDKWARAQDYMGELGKIAKLAGLSEEKFEACMQDESVLDAVLKDRQEGMQKYKVDSTPTFFVNGDEKISGNVPLEDFEEVLDSYFE
ncbi:DsbA family protein [Curvivirga sp.]|uniref:DsbA family protein n=1 Tax=Curvivirga sp. TaxID=2856848 RepID=UPI003B5A7259